MAKFHRDRIFMGPSPITVWFDEFANQKDFLQLVCLFFTCAVAPLISCGTRRALGVRGTHFQGTIATNEFIYLFIYIFSLCEGFGLTTTAIWMR